MSGAQIRFVWSQIRFCQVTQSSLVRTFLQACLSCRWAPDLIPNFLMLVTNMNACFNQLKQRPAR